MDKVNYTESDTFRSMPQSVIDRLLSHKTNTNSSQMTEELIDELISKSASNGVLDLSGCQLTGEAPYFVLDSLSRNEYVNFQHVNLSSSNITSGGFSVLMDFFIYFNYLEILNFQNNNLPKEAGVAIAKILGTKSPLQVVNASGNALSDAGVAAIAGAFTVDLSRLTSPSLLTLTDSPRSHISILSLSVLDLSKNNFGDGGLLALCRGLTHFLKSMISRSSVDANNNPFVTNNKEEKSRDRALVSLRVLRLGHNKCGDKAAVCLAQFLTSFYRPGYLPLEELSIGHNPIGQNGVLALLRAIELRSGEHDESLLLSPTLIRLDLAECGGSLGVLEELARVVSGNNVQELDLSLSEDDAQQACSSAMYVDTIVTLAAAVSHSTQSKRPLTMLKLGHLIEITKKEMSSMLPGSTSFYALRVALDSFRSIKESLQVGGRRAVRSVSPSSLSVSHGALSVTALQLQQEDFEQLRKEHSMAFHELSDEINRIPDVALQSTLHFALQNINNTDSTSLIQKTKDNDQQHYSQTSKLASVFEPIRDNQPRNDSYSQLARPTPSTTQIPLLYTQAEINDIIQRSVSMALDSAYQRWQQDASGGVRQVSTTSDTDGGSNTIPTASLEDRLHQVVSRVDIIQEQMQTFDSQAFAITDHTGQCEELNRIAVQLESRIARLESRLDHLEIGTSRNHAEIHNILAEDKDGLGRRFEQLLARMSSLENSVEAEHETSLDLLDVLLMKKSKSSASATLPTSPNAGLNAQNGRNTSKTSSNSKNSIVRRSN